MAQDLSWLPTPPRSTPTAAPVAQPAPRGNLSWLPTPPATPPPAASSMWDSIVNAADVAIPTILRVGGGVVGSIAGGVAGLPSGPGALATAALGGATGSGVGTTAAQAYEIWRGRREEFNPTAIAVDTALGAVPVLGKAGSVVKTVASRAAQGAVLGAGGDAAMRWAEGQEQDLGGSLTSGAIGAVVGGGLGAVEARRLSRGLRGAPAADVPVTPRPTDVTPAPVAAAAETPSVAAPKPSPVPPQFESKVRIVEPVRTTPAFEPAFTGLKTDAPSINETVFYHGTGAPDLTAGTVDPMVTNADGLFGTGFYLTTNPNIAQGYAKARGRNSTPTVYRAKVNIERALNLEDPPTPAVADAFLSTAQRLDQAFNSETADAVRTALQRPGATAADVWRALSGGVSETSADLQVPSYEFSDYFLDLSENLRRQGFDALTHTGGQRTGRPAHQVLILLDPNDKYGQIGRSGQLAALNPQGTPDFQQATPTVNPTQSFTDAPVLTSSTQALDTPAPIDDLQVRTPRPTASPEAARLARVVNQEGLPPTAPIPEHRRVTEQMVARFPEEQRAGMLEVIEKNNAFESARRGVQSDARRSALAQHIEMDLSKQLRPGTILSAEETDHLAGTLLGVQNRLAELSERVSAGTATEWDKFSLAQARQEQATLAASFFGTRAEQGRALRAQRFMAEVMRSGDIGAIRKILQQHPDLKNVEGFAQDFLNKGTDAEKMAFAMEELRKRRSWSDTALAVWYANVLSGPKTHLRNLIGSGSNIAFREISNAVGTGYDAARSAVTGAPRTMYASEIPHRAVGAWNGFRKGLTDAAFVMQNGYSQEAIEAFDTPRIELAGGGKNPFNLPGRMLEAEDALMYRTVYEANVAGLLNAKARQSVAKAGVSGPEADRMVDDFLTNAMLNVPKDVAEAAKKTALAALFREEPGSFVSWILDKKNAGPMGKALSFVVPFVRVPGNLFRQAIENNVVGMAVTKQGRDALKAGGRESAELIGRAVTGTAALGVLATWVAQGRVSGGGPSNPAERTALMETGWKPYSVNIPGKGWVDYNLVFQPVAMPLAMLANAWDMYKANGDEKALDDLAVSSAFSMGSTLLDQSFLSGASDFNAAMTNPTQFAKNWAARTAQGAVPLSGLSRNVAQTVDPTVRDVADPSVMGQIGKGIQSIVPGVSQGLPARLDRFGRPVERTGGAAAGILPITVSRPTDDPVVTGLESLGIRSVGAPAKTIGTKGSTTAPLQTLTPEDRAALGQAVHTALENLFRTSLPQLQQMDPAAAEARVQRVVEDARARVRAEIRRR